MRVTAETKQATRERILDASRQLFAANKFELATTREIADRAGIAVGTLFNYFPSKESVVATLASQAISEAHQDHVDLPKGTGLEEAVFALIAAELRKLKPLRRQLPPVLDALLSPLAAENGRDGTPSLRALHLEAFHRAAVQSGFRDLSPVAFQIYWALYSGLLIFWANDASPNQEDTLALLDQSLEMFLGWLQSQAQQPT